MSRTARLFTLLDALRAHRRPVAAEQLAQDLGVSVRTIYRDMQTLAGLGAPIAGEAGVGYVLTPGFFLPPLMFDADELEALVLGARWVRGQGDEALAQAADRALAKIATASPKDMREAMANTGLWTHSTTGSAGSMRAGLLKMLREAIRHEHKLALAYTDEQGRTSERTVWPIGLAFFERTRMVIAWCELRADFRHFRTDRIAQCECGGERYPQRRAALVKAWRREQEISEE
ncbi:MAG: YafY family transcriptional regulator [Betaproteobacteria bacterium]|nr:YafY family transcriptional regulator [Betaproteobacteria bacterium]